MGRSYFPGKTPGGTEFNTIFKVDPNDGRILASWNTSQTGGYFRWN